MYREAFAVIGLEAIVCNVCFVMQKSWILSWQEGARMGKLYWQTNLLQTHHLPPCRTALTQINERSVALNSADEQIHSPRRTTKPPHHTWQYSSFRKIHPYPLPDYQHFTFLLQYILFRMQQGNRFNCTFIKLLHKIVCQSIHLSIYTRQHTRQQCSIDQQRQHRSSDIEHEPNYDINCKNKQILVNPFELLSQTFCKKTKSKLLK